jgi:hypothetical protein
MPEIPENLDLWVAGYVQQNPEIAANLGVFLAEFATLEACLIWALEIILDDWGGEEADERSVAWGILGPVQSVTTRCQIVEDAAANRSSLEQGMRAGITSLISDIRKMNSVRNEFVHALYETNLKTAEVRLTTFAMSTSRKQTKKLVQASELVMHINIMRSISREMMEAHMHLNPKTRAQS